MDRRNFAKVWLNGLGQKLEGFFYFFILYFISPSRSSRRYSSRINSAQSKPIISQPPAPLAPHPSPSDTLHKLLENPFFWDPNRIVLKRTMIAVAKNGGGVLRGGVVVVVVGNQAGGVGGGANALWLY